MPGHPAHGRTATTGVACTWWHGRGSHDQASADSSGCGCRATLPTEERQQLELLVRGGTGAVRMIKRAQILLAADAGSPCPRKNGNNWSCLYVVARARFA